MFPTYGRQILQYQFGRFRLPRARLSTDHYALILTIPPHMGIRVVADGEYVRRQFSYFTLFIQFNLIRRVDREYLVGIDRHQYRAGIRLK